MVVNYLSTVAFYALDFMHVAVMDKTDLFFQ